MKQDKKIRDWFLIKDTIFVTVNTHNGNVSVMPYDEWQQMREQNENRRMKKK